MTAPDGLGPEIAMAAEGLLATMNAAGLLIAADVQVARRLDRLAQSAGISPQSQEALLGIALAVRAVRLGSVCLDLRTLPDAGTSGQERELLLRGMMLDESLAEPADAEADAVAAAIQAWPAVPDWVDCMAASRLVSSEGSGSGTGEPDLPPGQASPLRLDGTRLYLQRYWQEETQVIADLDERAASVPPLEQTGLAASLAAYFPQAEDSDQREAARAAAVSGTCVITGGPGTGKTTTVARLLGVLLDADEHLRIGLAAPTGKAAARMAQAVRGATGVAGFPSRHAERIAGLRAGTLHRLLGSLPDQRTRFRHHRGNRLPLDLVVVDETSMVSLTMMARLLEALRPSARLVLVGDADQLASVEAGAVLGDLVSGLRQRRGAAVATLTRNRRSTGQITALAAAVREGRADEAAELLRAGEAAGPAGSGDVGFVPADRLRELALGPALRLRAMAEQGDRAGALAALEEHRLLCPHREGPAGVRHWNARIEEWIAEATRVRLGRWYPGQPLLITANDYALGLFNGDTGVVVRDEAGGLRAVIGDGESTGGRSFALARLSDVTTAHAMTVHRAQGSQFTDVTVILPEEDSRILTRELVYTAITRARTRVRMVGEPDVLRRAVAQHAGRATGLAQRLA